MTTNEPTGSSRNIKLFTARLLCVAASVHSLFTGMCLFSLWDVRANHRVHVAQNLATHTEPVHIGTNSQNDREILMSKAKRSAIALMYNALMAIGCLDEFLHSPQWCLERAREIAGHAIKEMNIEHTEEVQRVLGIWKKL